MINFSLEDFSIFCEDFTLFLYYFLPFWAINWNFDQQHWLLQFASFLLQVLIFNFFRHFIFSSSSLSLSSISPHLPLFLSSSVLSISASIFLALVMLCHLFSFLLRSFLLKPSLFVHYSTQQDLLEFYELNWIYLMLKWNPSNQIRLMLYVREIWHSQDFLHLLSLSSFDNTSDKSTELSFLHRFHHKFLPYYWGRE